MTSILPTAPFYIPPSSSRQLDQVQQLQNTIGTVGGQKTINKQGLLSSEGKGISDNNRVSDFKKIDEVSRQFESIFIHQMLKAMRKTVIRSDYLGGFATEQYESMLDEEIANEVSKHKGIGLAEVIHRQLDHLMQQSPRP